MKKKHQQSEEASPGQPSEASSGQQSEASPGQPSTDYVVGQVCDSVFQKKAAAPGSLSALFSAAAPAAAVLFQPAPKPVPKVAEVKEPQKETPDVKGQTSQKQKKLQKEKTAAEEKLENRESSLQNADEAEQGQTTTVKKKKRKAPEADGENEVERWVIKRQKLRAQKQEEALKKNKTVFVGNLPVSCTKKTLRSLFKDKGSIESIRFRSVAREDPSISRKVAAIQRKVHPKKQSVNAYVVFKDEEGVMKALERNGMEIEKDFYIRVDRVNDGSSHDHKRSVFVGNLSFEINDLAFRRHFEECGDVEAVRLVRDQNSGLGKGFGYVLFENSDSVQLALELDGSSLEGRKIRVKRSVNKDKLKEKGDGKGGKGGKGAAGKGSAKIPGKGPGTVRGGGFKSQKKFARNQPSSNKNFKGEMADPTKKTKKKGLKKKRAKPRKTVHI
ncbi:RNA-binding protein 34 [Scomber japonicus]|uniref:RNA-binding protein 34 n=1 Tax=Scomber japonicus TaxID=13676 RepID=UPI0023061904|nr:RNA-binding protein 34 [Scomber japonicus]